MQPKPCPGDNWFVVHEHWAKRAGLHYDIRLTYYNPVTKECSLLSFATRKLPDLVACKTPRIQAFPTEDHSLEYGDFQGEIPEGYGAGLVKIWDKGKLEYVELTWTKVKAIFHGKKMKGQFTFIRLDKPNKTPKTFYEGDWLFVRSCKKSK